MARHEPLGRAAPGAPPGMKVTVRLGPDGKPQVVVPAKAPDPEPQRDDEDEDRA